jgi:hypothetical protein
MRHCGFRVQRPNTGSRAILLVLLLLHLSSTAAIAPQVVNPLPPVDPECKLYARMAGLVVPYGYPLEEHFVETVSLQQLLMLAVASTCTHSGLFGSGNACCSC